MISLTIIRDEHRNLATVLATLERHVAEIDMGGAMPEFRLLHGIVQYVDEFLDRFHHPKETAYLFPALRRRCPSAAVLLHELEREHADSEKRATELLRSLSAYEFHGAGGFPAFRDTVRAYVEFQRRHAMCEEKEVLPLAREHLRADDWTRIDAAFTSHVDPLFGDQPQRAFRQLYESILRLPSGAVEPGDRGGG